MANWYSQTWTFLDGRWQEGNPPMMGPRTHAAWQASSVFDGARIFENVMPDIDRHAARVNQSALKMGLKPTMQPAEIVALAREGAKKFAKGTAVYVKPMYWGEADGLYTICPDPELDPLLPLPVRGADAGTGRLQPHRVELPPAIA